MSLKKIIDVKEVNSLLKHGMLNKEGIRVIDCSFAVSGRPEWRDFRKDNYGKFEKLMAKPTLPKKLYLSGHIPEAIHVDLDIAMYPSRYQRFTHYPDELFEEYAQLLGLNNDENLIFYGRGAMSGMLFASKVAWLFRTYGYDKISLVEGGFESWMKNKFDIANDDVKLPRGNFTAKNKVYDHVITFEELENKNAGDKQYIEKTDKVNFLDSRGRGQFNGTEETGLDPNLVNGTRIPGFKNLPSAELFGKDGVLKNEEEIKSWLLTNGYVQGQETVTSCNSGVQAALLAYVLDSVEPESKPRLYNGSLKEMELRDPKKISEGPQHLP